MGSIPEVSGAARVDCVDRSANRLRGNQGRCVAPGTDAWGIVLRDLRSITARETAHHIKRALYIEVSGRVGDIVYLVCFICAVIRGGKSGGQRPEPYI